MSILAKVFGIILKIRVDEYLAKNNIFSIIQLGLHSNESTVI